MQCVRFLRSGGDFNDGSDRNMSSNSLALEKAVHWFQPSNHLIDFTDGKEALLIEIYSKLCNLLHPMVILIWFKFDAIKQRSALTSIWIYLLCKPLTAGWLAHWLKTLRKRTLFIGIRDGQLFLKFISGRNKRLSLTNCILNELNTEIVIKVLPKLW